MTEIASVAPEIWGTVGMVVVALVGLGIFASKADVANLRADYERDKANLYLKFGNYMSRHETADALQSLRNEVTELRNDIKEILQRLPRLGG